MPIPIAQLINYFENPRHAIGSNEEDTLKKLFEAVGIQYMLNLAEDVQKNGLLGNQQIVVVFSDALQKYVVYDGNRRVAAIKLLTNPELFAFLDHASSERAKKIRQQGNIPTTINCYVTDEADAFFIMERTHSGEDMGRGTKRWNAREKEAFRVRQSHQKKVSYLIDYYCKKYFDDIDITKILPFTTIERIFNNREIKKTIGIEVADEQSFTAEKMQLIINASIWVAQEAASSGTSVTRLFNKARTIENKLIPWLNEHIGKEVETPRGLEARGATNKVNEIISFGKKHRESNDRREGSEEGKGNSKYSARTSAGGCHNLPYFFQGLDYSGLDPNDANSHGVSAVCRELQLFSNRKLVESFPIAATFLVRTIIEQAIIYYSKKHNIQGQSKLIWEDIKSITKLSKIIEKYKRNLPNYIDDTGMRQYFMNLFGNYEDNVDPLNWVVHKPAEFKLDPKTLIALPRKGLLKIINFLIS